MAQMIKFNTYKKRDGSLMLFINGQHGCSVGVSAEKGLPSDYGKNTTQGQRKLLETIREKFAEFPKFTGDLNKHTETGFCAVQRLQDGYTLVGTDVCDIGGMHVSSDGHYVVIDDKRIVRCNEWV